MDEYLSQIRRLSQRAAPTLELPVAGDAQVAASRVCIDRSGRLLYGPD